MTYFGIYLSNRKICGKGGYTNPSGEFTDISAFRTITETVISPSAQKENKPPRSFSVSESIVKKTSISAALELDDEGCEKIIVLNFANAMCRGGAYFLGGNAQEESLCRASLLHHSLKEAKGYYGYNRIRLTPLYSDRMIFSENVPIIRDESGKLLDKPVPCSFITSPAVNHRIARFICTQSRIDRVMDERIRKIILLLAEKKPDAAVLGAFSCGMFGNKREKIYPLFEKYIGMYTDEKFRIVFAEP